MRYRKKRSRSIKMLSFSGKIAKIGAEDPEIIVLQTIVKKR